jgi:hypothetical protein
MTPKPKSPLTLAQTKQIEQGIREMAVARYCEYDIAKARQVMFKQFVALNAALAAGE